MPSEYDIKTAGGNRAGEAPAPLDRADIQAHRRPAELGAKNIFSRFLGAKGRIHDLHRRACAQQPDRAAGGIPDAVAEPALRCRQGEMDRAGYRPQRGREIDRTPDRPPSSAIRMRSPAAGASPAADDSEDRARPHCRIHLTFCRSAQAAMGSAIAALAVAATALVVTAGAQAQPQSTPDVGHFSSANGLEVVVIPDRRAPVVTHMIWYKVGAADETPGKSGLAHFLEHLMFKGTEKNPAGRFSQAWSRPSAARRTPSPRSDYTGYFQRVPRDQLKTMMEFEADRMTGLVLTDEVVLPERNVVLEEQNQRVANNPARAARRADRCRALSQSSLRPAGDRLAPRDREAQPRGRARLLPALLHAQQRRPGGRRRRRPPTRSRRWREETYGKVAAASPRSAARSGRRSRRRSRRAHVTLADPRVAAAEPAALLSRAVVRHREGRRSRSARSAVAHSRQRRDQPALPRRSWSSSELAVSAGAWYNGTALDATQFGVYGSPQAGRHPASSSRAPSTR